MQASMGMSQQSSCGHHSCITRKEIKMKARTKKTSKVADKENVTVEIYEASKMIMIVVSKRGKTLFSKRYETVEEAKKAFRKIQESGKYSIS